MHSLNCTTPEYNSSPAFFVPVSSMPVEDDAALLQLWGCGYDDAGQTLFCSYYPLIERFFLNKVDPNLAPELVAKTFIACLDRRHTLTDDRPFYAYVLTAAHDVFTGYLRARYRYSVPACVEQTLSRGGQASPSETLLPRSEDHLLLAALRAIPMRYQVVLELHYWEQLDTRLIADIVGVPAATVRSRLRRGRDALEAAMQRATCAAHAPESAGASLDAWVQQCGAALRERAAIDLE